MAAIVTFLCIVLNLSSFGRATQDLSIRRDKLVAHALRRSSSTRNVPAEGYYDPRSRGGSMLTSVPVTYPAGLGEPLNVILSGNSDAAVLIDQPSDGGLRNYFFSIGFAGECLGQHSGSDQSANLGDGNGYKNETAVIRWDYGDASFGTCKETIQGGNHFRYWVQDGTDANSGAVFMALSYELPLSLEHDIIMNGYNLARDQLVGNATQQSIDTSVLTNSSSFSGSTSYNGYTYQTDVQYTPGLLPNTSSGINHYITVTPVNGTAVDGLVAVLTVKITTKPQSASSSSVSNYRTMTYCMTLIPLLAIVLLSL